MFPNGGARSALEQNAIWYHKGMEALGSILEHLVAFGSVWERLGTLGGIWLYLKYSGAFVNIWEHLDTLGSKVPYGIIKVWKQFGAFGCIRLYLNVLWGPLIVFGIIWVKNPYGIRHA